eukprot:scaffold94953_cov69-Phaeocystis_antarctica.AAC.1
MDGSAACGSVVGERGAGSSGRKEVRHVRSLALSEACGLVPTRCSEAVTGATNLVINCDTPKGPTCKDPLSVVSVPGMSVCADPVTSRTHLGARESGCRAVWCRSTKEIKGYHRTRGFSSERNEQGFQNSQGAHFLPSLLGVSIYIEFREKRNPTHVGQLFSAKRRRSHTDLFSVEKEDDLPRRRRCLRHFRRRPASRPDRDADAVTGYVRGPKWHLDAGVRPAPVSKVCAKRVGRLADALVRRSHRAAHDAHAEAAYAEADCNDLPGAVRQGGAGGALGDECDAIARDARRRDRPPARRSLKVLMVPPSVKCARRW